MRCALSIHVTAAWCRWPRPHSTLLRDPHPKRPRLDTAARRLKCLPVFLTSCSEFVVLLGPHYMTRLWCLIEVFTFLRVGASVSRTTVIPPTDR